MVTLSYQENQSMEVQCLVSAASEDFASQEQSITSTILHSLSRSLSKVSPPLPHSITDTPTSHASHPAKHLNLHPGIRWADSQDTWVWDPMHSVHVASCDDNNAAVTQVPTCSPGLLAEPQVVMNLNRLMGYTLSLISLPLCFPLLRLTGKQRQLCAWNTLKTLHRNILKWQSFK